MGEARSSVGVPAALTVRRSSMSEVVAGTALGWCLDQVIGEPPVRWHPVVHFGRAMTALERRLHPWPQERVDCTSRSSSTRTDDGSPLSTDDPSSPAGPTRTSRALRSERRRGELHVSIAVVASIAVGLAAERLLGRRTAAAGATWVCVAGRMLRAEAIAVEDLLQQADLDRARERVRSLVGRSTHDLDEAEIARATVESLAENTVDAVTGPLFWAAVAGAPGVLTHRAVNTLDAMVGHRTDRYEHFGRAAARLDDALNYVPARLSAVGLAILTPSRTRQIWRTVREDAPAHPSPNGGVIEGATAAALGIRLGGTNDYAGRIEARGVLGDGDPPGVSDIRRACTLMWRLGALAASSAVVISVMTAPG